MKMIPLPENYMLVWQSTRQSQKLPPSLSWVWYFVVNLPSHICV